LLPEVHREANRERKGSADILDVFRQYAAATAAFSHIERELLAIFSLTQLYRTQFWFNFITGPKESARHTELSYALRTFLVFTPRIVKLLQTDATRLKYAGRKTEGHEVLTTILIEPADKASRPDRLVDALRSITTLYEVVATIQQVPLDTLSVVGCDSGSDKSFDFLGVSSAIRNVKDILIEVWDRVVFYRQLRAEANVQAALRSLSVVDEVSRLRDEGKLGPEEAERLKHKALTGASLFLECGMTIPELDAHTSNNPRVLLAPQPKLLAGTNLATGSPNGKAEADDVEQAPSLDVQNEGLSAEDERLLRRLLDKARRSE